MAVSNKGTVVAIPSGQVPVGYTLPTVATFTDFQYKFATKVFTILKSSVDDPTELTGFTALVAAIETAVTTLMGVDFDDAVKTVDCWADWNILSTDQETGQSLYTDDAPNYFITVDIWIKIS